MKRALLVGSALLGLLLVGVWGFWPWYDVDDQSAEDDERAADSLARDRDRRPGGSIRVPTRPPSPYLTARTTEEEGAGAGMFEGQVLSWATGEPVPEVELTFARESTVSSTMTDLEGGFYFRASVAGTYELVAVTADGYLPFAPEWGHSPVRLEARPGYRVRDIIIHLRPVEELVGVVTSPDGRPVAGAEVAVISTPAGRSSLSTFPESYVSDENGEFQLQAPLGTILEARLAQFAAGRARLDRPAWHRRRLEIRLRTGPNPMSGETIAGQAFDDRGRPLEGVLVMARSVLRSPRLLIASSQALTGEDGTFEIEGLDRGRYNLQATADGLAPTRLMGVLTGTTDARIVLQAGGSIVGTVRDEATGRPVPSFSVVVESRFGPLRLMPYRTESVFDAEGRYELTGLEPRQYVVRITSTGRSPSDAREVTIAPSTREVRLDFSLDSGGRAHGVVVDSESGQPIYDARVSIESRGNQSGSPVPLVAQTVTDHRGRFDVRGLAAGRRSLVITARGYHRYLLTALDVQEGEDIGPLEIELSPAEDGAEPEVELSGIGAVMAPRRADLMIVRVIEGGGAREAGLVPGDMVLRVDGLPVVDLGFMGAIERIRGQEGTAVGLTVRRAASGEVQDVTVLRSRVRG